MTDVMSPREFKYGMLKLSDGSVGENSWARRLAATYIDAEKTVQEDCSIMLRGDLKTMELSHELDKALE